MNMLMESTLLRLYAVAALAVCSPDAMAENKSSPYQEGCHASERHDWNRAIPLFTKAIRSDPGHAAAAYLGRGYAYHRTGDNEKALHDYNESIRLDPKDARPYCNRGNVYSDQNRFDKALADLNKAISLDSQDASYYIDRGSVYWKSRDLDRAISDFDRAEKLSPNLVSIYTNRGVAYIDKGQYEKALVDENKAIRLSPTSGVSYANRGVAYSAKEDYKRAISDLETAVRLDYEPAYWLLNLLLATCPDRKLRNGAKALRYATKHCELAHWNDATRFGSLAAAYAQLGQFEKAVIWQKKYIAAVEGSEKKYAKIRLEQYEARQPLP
jgi:tetratricopeptide (TPR) repeat protein